MSLKKCVLKIFFKEFLQPAFIAALPPSPLQKILMLHFCSFLYNLLVILYDQSHILFGRIKVCLQKMLLRVFLLTRAGKTLGLTWDI